MGSVIKRWTHEFKNYIPIPRNRSPSYVYIYICIYLFTVSVFNSSGYRFEIENIITKNKKKTWRGSVLHLPEGRDCNEKSSGYEEI
jgi:hypothetical protein